MSINKLLPLILIIVINLGDRVLAQNYQWTRFAGGSGWEVSHGCPVDSNGNVFITGGFFSPNITFGNYLLNNAGSEDAFVVKYDSNGNVVWAEVIAGPGMEEGLSCATDGPGNIFVTGIFDGILNLGDTVLNMAGSSTDIFFAKYDTNGNVQWAKAIGGNGGERADKCATDIFGNVFITGSFNSDLIVFGNDTLTRSGGQDMFLAKYDSNGNLLWVKSSEGMNDEIGISCATDKDGNIIVTGYFNDSSAIFDSITLFCTGWWKDIFLIKYDKNGNLMWAKSASGNETDEVVDCATDNNGNIFICGYYLSDSINFGGVTLNNPFPGNGNMFLVKCDKNGNGLWAKTVAAYSCITDVNNNVFVTGYMGNMFIVKYDSSGNTLLNIPGGASGLDMGLSIALDVNENIFVTGSFSSSSVTLGNDTLTNMGLYDIFLTKIGNNTAYIEPLFTNSQFQIYPNPNDGSMKLDYTLPENSKALLKIFDLTGRMVEYHIIKGLGQLQINSSDLNDGLYFYEIESEGQIIVKEKLVIVK